MFYCISCEKAHKFEGRNDGVFKTGFVFIEGKKVPFGSWKTKKQTVNTITRSRIYDT